MSFWKAKTTIRKPDNLFSRFIRNRANWRCQVKVNCHGTFDFRSDPQGLTCAHIIGRRNEAVRFDPDNAMAACRPCHNYIEEEPGKTWFTRWAAGRLGERGWALLNLRASQRTVRDDAMMNLLLISMLEAQGDYEKSPKRKKAVAKN